LLVSGCWFLVAGFWLLVPAPQLRPTTRSSQQSVASNQ